MSNNLQRTTVTSNQDDKETTINDSDGVIDAAVTEEFTADVSSANVSLTAAQYAQAIKILIDGATTAGRTVTLPAQKGFKYVLSASGNTQTVDLVVGATTVTVTAGGQTLIYTDGTANGLEEISVGGGGGSIDVQEGGSSVVAAATALNFAAADFNITDEGSGVAGIAVAGGGGGGGATGGMPGTWRGARVELSGAFTTSGSAEQVTGWDTQTVQTKSVEGFKFWLGANLNFTADNTTNRLTATAHDMITGDGPFQLTNSGGALPTGLATGTDYWAILVDANTIQVASTFANAIAGTAVTFSDNGTGTHTLDREDRLVVPGPTSETWKIRVHAGLEFASGSVSEFVNMFVTQAGGSTYPGVSAVGDNTSTTASQKALQINSPVLSVVGGQYFELYVDADPNVDNNNATFFEIEALGRSSQADLSAGNNYPYAPPKISDFGAHTINMGTPVRHTNVDNVGGILEPNVGDGTTRLRATFIAQTLADGEAVTARILDSHYDTNGQFSSLCLYDNTDDEYFFAGRGVDPSNGTRMRYGRFLTGGVTEGATATVTGEIFEWFRFRRSGTDLVIELSSDGEVWSAWATIAAATFQVAQVSHVGYGVRQFSGETGGTGGFSMSYFDAPDYPASERINLNQ